MGPPPPVSPRQGERPRLQYGTSRRSAQPNRPTTSPGVRDDRRSPHATPRRRAALATRAPATARPQHAWPRPRPIANRARTFLPCHVAERLAVRLSDTTTEVRVGAGRHEG